MKMWWLREMLWLIFGGDVAAHFQGDVMAYCSGDVPAYWLGDVVVHMTLITDHAT